VEYTPGRRRLQEDYFNLWDTSFGVRPQFTNWLIAVVFTLTMGYAAPPARVSVQNGRAGVLATEQLRDCRPLREAIEKPHAETVRRAAFIARDTFQGSPDFGPTLFQRPPPSLF
jgi:hypothetical protein